MSILFKDIYSKSISLFDDPKITIAYENNIIQFEKIMYTYLQNAILMFHNPASIAIKLADYSTPIGKMETYEADGINNKFSIDNTLLEILNNEDYKNGVDYVFIENNMYVNGTVNLEDGTVEFPDVLPEGQEYAFEVYYCGAFLNEFDGYNINTTKINATITNQIQGILARLLVRAWAEEERNMVLDIRNIMQDTDFKLMSNDRILNSKNNWIDQLDQELFQLQNRLAWTIRFGYTSTNIGRG